MSQPAIDVRSEIGALKRVLLHRPGRELENLMPEYIERLLFDDIPYLKIAQEEHDAFCALLRENGRVSPGIPHRGGYPGREAHRHDSGLL